MRNTVNTTKGRLASRAAVGGTVAALLVASPVVASYPNAFATPSSSATTEGTAGSTDSATDNGGTTGKSPSLDTDSPSTGEGSFSNEDLGTKTPPSASGSLSGSGAAAASEAASEAASDEKKQKVIESLQDQYLKSSGLTQEEFDAIRAEINSRQDELTATNKELDDLKESIHAREAEAASIERLIASKNEQISDAEKKIVELDKEMEANRSLLAMYVTENYKFESNWLEEIFSAVTSAKSFSELTNKLDYYSSLNSKQAETVDTIAEKKNEQEKLKFDLEDAREIVSQSSSDLAAAQKGVEKARTDYETRIEALGDTITLLKGKALLDQEGYVSRVWGALTVVPADMTEAEATIRARIVSDAMEQLGVPYVWGGESLAEGGFDCSGICYYSYGRSGITLPRVAVDQYNATPKIDASSLRPGDLIFQGSTSADIYHVMMYIGDGLTLEAPQPGDVVKIASLSGRGGIYGYTSPLAAFKWA